MKKADLVILDALSVAASNNNNPRQLVKIFPQPLATIQSSFSVQKGQQELLQMLNQGMELLRNLGIADDILNHYDPSGKLLARVGKKWTDFK